MNIDVEDLLREGMERFTKDLQAPAGMTRRAARRRCRRLALRSVAVGAAALTAGAVAVVAAGVPGTGGTAVAAAYVVKRVGSALSAADPGEIAQVTVTTTRRGPMPGGTSATTTAEEWSYGNQWRSVTYSSAGHPVYDEGFSAASVYTLVNYPARIWSRQRGLGRPAAPISGPRGCEPLGAIEPPGRPVPVLFQPGLPGIGFSATSPPATVARALRTAVSCGTLAVAGRQRVDGIEATELTSRPGSLISETIWVSPGTYLPVRVIVRMTPFGLRQTADITWLPPTAQNLAKLIVPIPAGFHRVTLPDALGLTVLPGGPQPLKPNVPCRPSPGSSVRRSVCPRLLLPPYRQPPKSS